MTDIVVAQMIGTLGCGYVAGGMMGLSLVTIPVLVIPARHPSTGARKTSGTSAAHLSHQWLNAYNRGLSIYPPTAAVSSLANAYLAWVLRDAPAPTAVNYSWGSIYATAAVITMGIMPWTFLVMWPTNTKLMAHAARDDAALAEGTKGMVVNEQEKAKRARDDQDVPALVEKWGELNFYRSLFVVAGAVIGFCGVVWME
ncbi:uncharacterized protein N7498_001232 [Penicillium cinerascens]|uniref:DUF1772-domain-containing protein n=1 Tax=Penicillium cinerascens TaxID=70096 RepID=A0A9W9NG40_9EURO|nr:uncharacterized protein N7498_001232 [Penicillium cinerascens]KAJ5219133.1 hypothetical protein N7498_001232 [Penicillium cinerascens]